MTKLLVGFVIFGHYLGCFWYAIVVWPLQTSLEVTDLHPWMWQDATPVDELTLYVCSLYWALAAMTNLKGNSAHESRQCLYHDPEVPTPLQERGEV